MAITKSNDERPEDILQDIYYDIQNPASYGGVKKIAKEANVPVKVAEKWLMKQDTYTLHKPAWERVTLFGGVKRRIHQIPSVVNNNRADVKITVVTLGTGDIPSVDMSKFSRQNKAIKFLLTSIDVFSKTAYVHALKN
ncbi:integrase catalytic domain-containing protein [Trichonephila clavipes]|nr:integrase catalytic domain-containing protein [Trichonephila clavipes]